MEILATVLPIIVPLLSAIALGILARRKQILSPQAVQGLQDFAVKICLPCVLFNAYLRSSFGFETLTAMALLLPLMLVSSLWSFRARRGRRFPYHNLPMLFSSKESGSLGIPLFLALFGPDKAFHMSAFDMAQAILAISVIALLAAAPGDTPSPRRIARRVATSPLLLMSLLGLTLNLTGAAAYLDRVGIGPILTESTGLLAQPVTALILFAIGYNFSLERENLGQILRLSLLIMAVFSLICAIIQGVLCFLPHVAPETRWALLLYCMLPPGFPAASLGRNEREAAIASGVCSLLTAAALVVFCVIAIFAV